MVLPPTKLRAIDRRIAKHGSVRTDQRHPIVQRAPRRVGEGVGIDAGTPLRCHETSVTKQLVPLLGGESRPQTAPRDRNDGQHEHAHDDQGAGEEALGELHALRDWPPRSR